VAECFSTGGNSFRIRDIASDIMKFEGFEVYRSVQDKVLM